MLRVSPRVFIPWGALAIAIANTSVFLVGGPDRPGTRSGENTDPSSVGQLVADTFRHSSILALLVALAFLLPAGRAAERWAGPIGVGSAYIVGGFAAGLAEAASPTQQTAPVGSLGGTTAVLAMWAASQARTTMPVAAPLAACCTWLWFHITYRANGVPWLGVIAAALVGLYASRASTTFLPGNRRGEQ